MTPALRIDRLGGPRDRDAASPCAAQHPQTARCLRAPRVGAGGESLRCSRGARALAAAPPANGTGAPRPRGPHHRHPRAARGAGAAAGAGRRGHRRAERIEARPGRAVGGRARVSCARHSGDRERNRIADRIRPRPCRSHRAADGIAGDLRPADPSAVCILNFGCQAIENTGMLQVGIDRFAVDSSVLASKRPARARDGPREASTIQRVMGRGSRNSMRDRSVPTRHACFFLQAIAAAATRPLRNRHIVSAPGRFLYFSCILQVRLAAFESAFAARF